MYGGRCIDSFDRRILTVYMDEYLGDFLFYTFRCFHFFNNKDVDYKIPQNGPKNIYVGQSLFSLLHIVFLSKKRNLSSLSFILLSVTDEIETLPLANTPEVMGLHSNAEIGYYTQAAKDMWTHLIDLQPQTGTIRHLTFLLLLHLFQRKKL